jgi:hypothetical protein
MLLSSGALTGCGGGSPGGLSTPPPAPSPVPVLSTITPVTAIPGGGAFTLTATGSFSPSSTLYWNGSPRATAVVSATQLTAQIMASDIVSGGTAQVSVTTSAPGGGTSAALTFTITAVNATVQQLAPGAGASSSSHYQLVATVGATPDNSAARSAHYMMQGGLTGASINVP